MKRVCSWCGKNLGELASDSHSKETITHGLCDECAHHIFAQTGMELVEYLDGLNEPVVVVDGEGTVKSANQQARTLLKKDLPDIEGYRGGEVFECKHSKQPEGCGNTIHCSGCVIRKTVMDTFETGKSYLKMPASLNHQTRDGEARVCYLISTEKVAGVVLLRIDSVGE